MCRKYIITGMSKKNAKAFCDIFIMPVKLSILDDFIDEILS